MNDTVVARLMVIEQMQLPCSLTCSFQQGKDFLEEELSSSLLISSPKRANRTVMTRNSKRKINVADVGIPQVESSHLDVSVKRRLEEVSRDVTRGR